MRADFAIVDYDPSEPDLYASLLSPAASVRETYHAGVRMTLGSL
jgi:hypothetical protein